MTFLGYQSYFHARMFDSDEDLSDGQDQCRRIICQNLVRLCKSNEEVKEKMTACLRFILSSKDVSQSWIGLIAETLCAFESTNDCELLYDKVLDLIEEQGSNYNSDVKTKLFTLAFQTALIAGVNCDPVLAFSVDGMDCWNVYRILRQAMRFGHFQFANVLADKLKSNISSEMIYFWMGSLSKMCVAESYLSNTKLPFNSRLSKAISTYVECITAVKGVISPIHQLQFQLEYLKLRLRTLKHMNLSECLVI